MVVSPNGNPVGPTSGGRRLALPQCYVLSAFSAQAGTLAHEYIQAHDIASGDWRSFARLRAASGTVAGQSFVARLGLAHLEYEDFDYPHGPPMVARYMCGAVCCA